MAKAKAPVIRDRVKELLRVKASDLVPHEQNWRTHPESQAEAMRGVLEQVGYAGAALAFRDDEGNLKLIDGHLRRELTPDEEIPVLLLDVNEDEAKLILATHDPLGALADADADMLAGLMGDIGVADLVTIEGVDTLLETIGDNYLPLDLIDRSVGVDTRGDGNERRHGVGMDVSLVSFSRLAGTVPIAVMDGLIERITAKFGDDKQEAITGLAEWLFDQLPGRTLEEHEAETAERARKEAEKDAARAARTKASE